jgi:hypothetical protein
MSLVDSYSYIGQRGGHRKGGKRKTGVGKDAQSSRREQQRQKQKEGGWEGGWEGGREGVRPEKPAPASAAPFPFLAHAQVRSWQDHEEEILLLPEARCQEGN